MKTLFVVVPLLVGMLILLYTIVANLLRVWLAHNVKMALLERLQHGVEDPTTPEDLQALLVYIGRRVFRRYRLWGGGGDIDPARRVDSLSDAAADAG